MTKIEITKDKSGNIVKFVIDGHSEFSQNEDIVCSAISSVSYATLNGIEKLLNIPFGYEKSDGYLYFVLPDDLKKELREQANILLNSMYLFFLDLEEQYKENVNIITLEV
ncbi:MAG: ribosomal-processing cysteine protease Prp [Ruminococcaceae bacterium]|nr:ribosomal-processing cysteine protease Prp [Oscillospiraceae bacterium]